MAFKYGNASVTDFSSTTTYANRYDLDEIDVFLEGDGNNPMFFNITGLPQNLSFGKHYFYISILDSKNQPYQLRQNSKILFEFKSSNNIVLISDVVKINSRNGIVTSFVQIEKYLEKTYEEVYDGQGTLTIVASLENKNNTQYIIPEKFIGAMNYRCVFPINIRKNLINADSPKILQSEHKKSTLNGQFSFAKAAISPLKTSKLGLTYDSANGIPNINITPSFINSKGNID